MNADTPSPSGDDPRPRPPRRYRVIQRVEGPVLSLVGLGCRDFARLTVARQDRPLTTSETLRLRLHGAMCGVCSRFAEQFSRLAGLYHEVEAEAAATEPDPAAARIAEQVRAKIAGRDDGQASRTD